MRKGLVTLALAGSLTAVSCSTMTVGVDYDRAVDFTVYRTFDVRRPPEVRNQLMAERLESAIERQLTARGFTRAERSPDLVVAVHGKVNKEVEFDTTTWGYGWGGWGYWRRYPAGGTVRTTARVVPVGTLIIDVVDAREKKLIWQAVASDTLDPTASPDERDRRVNTAMEKVFKEFPPTAK